MSTMKTQMKRLQIEGILAVGLENIFVIFLLNNVATFFTCPKILYEAKLECSELRFAGEIPRQLRTDYVAQLLLIIFMQIYNEKDQAEPKALQNIHFVEKKSTKTFNVGAKSCARRDEKFQQRFRVKWNKGSGTIRARPHQTKLLEKIKSYSTKETINNSKLM